MINTDILYTKFIEHVGQRKSGYFGLSTSEGIGGSMNRHQGVPTKNRADTYIRLPYYCYFKAYLAFKYKPSLEPK